MSDQFGLALALTLALSLSLSISYFFYILWSIFAITHRRIPHSLCRYSRRESKR